MVIQQTYLPAKGCVVTRIALAKATALLFVVGGLNAQDVPVPAAFPVPLPAHLPVLSPSQEAAMDRDLMEATIPSLHALYQAHRYTVEQVTRWYLDRIARYNGIYRSVQTVDVEGALATARKEDAESRGEHGPLWGVPMVIKANTAVAGLPDTDGWEGFAIPGHAFLAPRDATVVVKLRAAGAVILGITNMPDFAASDTNRSTAFGRTGNAYDVRFSPGGSSGGTVTTVTSNEAMLGTGTDTGNSIRMVAGTSAVVGLFPTRGLVSIAGIAPLDWLLDNTGPIARTVTDVAIALGVMAGEDPQDFKTAGSDGKAQPAPYTQYLEPGALKGKRFGVPAFIFSSTGTPLQPETKDMLLKTVERVRAAGAEVVLDDNLLPLTFLEAEKKVNTGPYRRDGAMQWLAAFGPAEYHNAEQYKAATGRSLPPVFTGVSGSLDDLVNAASGDSSAPQSPIPASGARRGADRSRNLPPQVELKTDPEAQKNYLGPRAAMLTQYLDALDRFHLDGLIYPSAQMPPPDETMPQDGKLSGGPHSETGWVNKIGVPAITVPAGFYPNGLPFGLEISARPWRDGDLLGWAYSFEQATKLRRPPTLVERGLTTEGPYRQ
jgi:aspartyl-tRNA(Asn)/glutamyl-tRNA(Gln) amidotransferase subunit A